MVDHKSPDFWDMAFTQTPPVLRWVFGILSLGVFTLCGVLYRWHRADMDEMHRRMDRMDDAARRRHEETNRRHDEISRMILQIASNTRREK